MERASTEATRLSLGMWPPESTIIDEERKQVQLGISAWPWHIVIQQFFQLLHLCFTAMGILLVCCWPQRSPTQRVPSYEARPTRHGRRGVVAAARLPRPSAPIKRSRLDSARLAMSAAPVDCVHDGRH